MDNQFTAVSFFHSKEDCEHSRDIRFTAVNFFI